MLTTGKMKVYKITYKLTDGIFIADTEADSVKEAVYYLLMEQPNAEIVKVELYEL